jgi:hypothetical protein
MEFKLSLILCERGNYEVPSYTAAFLTTTWLSDDRATKILVLLDHSSVYGTETQSGALPTSATPAVKIK